MEVYGVATVAKGLRDGVALTDCSIECGTEAVGSLVVEFAAGAYYYWHRH